MAEDLITTKKVIAGTGFHFIDVAPIRTFLDIRKVDTAIDRPLPVALMKSDSLNIVAESAPVPVKVVGGVLIFIAFAAAANVLWLAIILCLAGAVLLTWHSGTQIDVSKKTYREYNSFLFIRTGSDESYNAIEKIFINRAKVSQTMNAPYTANSSTFHKEIFNAYLKFDDGKKIFLTSRTDKAALIVRLDEVVTVLNTQLVDNT